MIKTACVLLNYRQPEKLLPLLKSVEACACPNKSIYVVDNGSGPESVDFLKHNIGSAKLVVTDANLGYAGGMNLGVQAALDDGADFLWLLAKDLTVEADCLQNLHSLWPRLSNPGLVGSLTDLNGTDQIYFFRASIDKLGRTKHGNKGRTIQQIPELKADYGPTDYVNGSSVFTHRDVIKKIGLIPEEYFLYFEDCEWGLRAKRAGYNNFVSYRSRVHHAREAGGFSSTAEYYCRRNAFLFKKRNGFARPWTKFFESLKLQKKLLKAKWEANTDIVKVLSEVQRDVAAEKTGAGPWR